MKVFVYGSLKKGFYNHYLIKGAQFVTTAVTTDSDYEMVSMGAFPGVYKGTTVNCRFQIAGEVYEVDDDQLEELDRLENNGQMYQRYQIAVKGIPEPVWMYFLLLDVTDYNIKPNTDIHTDHENMIQTWVKTVKKSRT
jgi:gamma-glutamylaminecyclotransferase